MPNQSKTEKLVISFCLSFLRYRNYQFKIFATWENVYNQHYFQVNSKVCYFQEIKSKSVNLEFNQSGTNPICMESALIIPIGRWLLTFEFWKKHSSKTRGTLQLQRVKIQEPFSSLNIKNLIFDVITPK